MMTDSQIQAIYKLYPKTVRMTEDKAFDSEGNLVDYDKEAIQAYVDAHAYIAKRQQAYAPLAEQLDMQYWDAVNGTTTWKEHIDAVKSAHPKGDE